MENQNHIFHLNVIFLLKKNQISQKNQKKYFLLETKAIFVMRNKMGVRKSSRDSGPPSRRHSNVRRLSTPQSKTQVKVIKLFG